MNVVDYSKIEALVNADTELDALRKELGIETNNGLNKSVAERIVRLREKEKEAVADEAAEEIYKLIKTSTTCRNDLVESIRYARRMEATAKHQLNLHNKAEEIANKYGDYKPLFQLVFVSPAAAESLIKEYEKKEVVKPARKSTPKPAAKVATKTTPKV